MILTLTPLHVIFYLFSGLALLSGVGVVTFRNPVYSVLSLVVTFFAMAGVWMLLRAEFLALILLLVYVGAVMTLFLFVVMMLNIDRERRHVRYAQWYSVGTILAMLVTGFLLIAVGPHYFGLSQMPVPPAEPADYSNVKALGEVLYTQYAYPFEIAGVILLAAIIAAITLSHRSVVRRKKQDVSAQLAARPSDRLRLVSMPPTPRESDV
ncbi:MAG TPA: NADH-quinone oxidoreductase subunit J [Gammaproteobacteria bacterium]|jgi:NADH-quinone oxidoreductase subunit J|nr:NADH-quinone oxidoreductase subunit J [Gammaproteobacteria bacterium]